jgi:4-alpha-glucanotransferase
VAQEDSLRRILEARGIGASTDAAVRDSLDARCAALRDQIVDPVRVVRSDHPGALPLRTTATLPDRGRLVLLDESGSAEESDVELRGATGGRVDVLLPPLPAGYFEATIEAGELRASSFLISAPRTTYQPGTPPSWGLFSPLFALRSSDSWGIGDFADGERAIAAAAEHGAGLFGTLPLLPTFLAEPFDPSPYAPVSRLFWNEIYLDLPSLLGEFGVALEELGDSAAITAEIARLQAEWLIDYRQVYALKRRVLEALLERIAPAGSRSDEEIHAAATTPLLEDYSRFRAAIDARRTGWRSWSGAERTGDLGADAGEPAARRYHTFVQWLCERRIGRLRESAGAAGVGLYLDFALGVHPDGFDAWRHQDLFVDGCRVGAAPDFAYGQGQNWGFPPLDPEALRAARYRYLIDSFRHHFRHASTLRLDHVMGLHRLYWIADGMTPRDGVYVRYRAAEIYAIVAVESHRARCSVVGEDLGTVPPYVRGMMSANGMRRLFVLQRQMTHVRNDPPGPLPRAAVASVNNHDMPPFAGYWSGRDIDEKEHLGVLAADRAAEERSRRTEVRAALTRILQRDSLLDRSEPGPAGVLRGSHRFLARSRAETVLISLDDLWLETESQNIPTTTFERPNWRRKAARPLEEWVADPGVGESLNEIDALRRKVEETDGGRAERAQSGGGDGEEEERR